MDNPILYRPSSLDIGILCTSSDNYENITYPHKHPDYELIIVYEGRHGVELEDANMILESGDLQLLRPGEIHSRYVVSQGNYLMIAFPSDEMDRVTALLDSPIYTIPLTSKMPPRYRLSSSDLETIRRQIRRINLYCSTDPSLAVSELRAMLCTLLTLYMKPEERRDTEIAPWLSHLMLQMTHPENMRGGIDAMLKMVPYTHEYLCREFRRMLDCSPTEYLNAIRLDYARKLLLDPSHSILDVCYSLGYSSLSYFYRLFRERFGSSPSRYRKEHLIAEPKAPREQSINDADLYST